MWKLDNNVLKDKANIWKSKNDWNFRTKDNYIHIENASKEKVLESSIDSKVIEESFMDGKLEQLWMQGKTRTDGYFTLSSSESHKLMTAVSASVLEIKGNVVRYLMLRFLTHHTLPVIMSRGSKLTLLSYQIEPLKNGPFLVLPSSLSRD